MENKNIVNVKFNQFYDELGNLKDEQHFEVIAYYKNTKDQWIEDKRTEAYGNYFIVDSKLYSRLDKTLLAMNMDFNSKTCGACYQIGKQLINNRKITGNEILFTCKSNLETGTSLKLYKQSYSDGTCFYTLQDRLGKWDVNHGSDNIQDLIKQMTLEIEIDQESTRKKYYKSNSKIKVIYDELKRWRQDVINNLQVCL